MAPSVVVGVGYGVLSTSDHSLGVKLVAVTSSPYHHELLKSSGITVLASEVGDASRVTLQEGLRSPPMT